MTNGSDPRLRQDQFERKDKENSNAGMIAAIIIIVLSIAGIFLYYNYEVAPAATPIATPTTTAPTAAPNNAPNNNPKTNNNQPVNTTTQTAPQ